MRATADVRLGKRLLGTAHAGRPVAWAITAVNHGPHRADGLVVVDPLPRAVEDPVATVTVGGGHCAVADRVARCTLHALAPGERAEVRVSGRLGPHAGGTFLDNGAELFEHEQDPAPRAAAHSDQVVVGPAADVEITADATPMVPVPGDLMTYHVRVEDNGPGTARGVRFAERLPSAVTPRSRCRPAAPSSPKVVRCDVGPLPPGTALGFDIVVRVARDAARQLLRARLSVGGAEPDPASADNRDVARTSVGRAPTAAPLHRLSSGRAPLHLERLLEVGGQLGAVERAGRSGSPGRTAAEREAHELLAVSMPSATVQAHARPSHDRPRQRCPSCCERHMRRRTCRSSACRPGTA